MGESDGAGACAAVLSGELGAAVVSVAGKVSVFMFFWRADWKVIRSSESERWIERNGHANDVHGGTAENAARNGMMTEAMPSST